MIITHKLKMNMEEEEVTQRLEMPLGDVSTRSIEMLLYLRQSPWTIPEGVTVLICYQKADGTRGEYDTMPDGTAAWSAADNTLTVSVAPQVLTAVGNVVLYAQMYLEEKVLHTFAVEIDVKVPFVKSRGMGAVSQDYYYATNVLRGPVMAQPGQILAVEEVDAYGRVSKVETLDAAALVNENGSAVLYKKQSLTSVEKEQARENIGAVSREMANYLAARLDNGSLSLPDQKTGDIHTLYAEKGKLNLSNQNEQSSSVTFLTNEDETRILNDAEVGKVLYTQQSLTDSQKAQARENIGAPAVKDVAVLQNKFVGERICLEDGKNTGDYYTVGIIKGKMEITQYDPITGAYGASETLLTDKDQAGIVEAVLAALPVYSGEVEDV